MKKEIMGMKKTMRLIKAELKKLFPDASDDILLDKSMSAWNTLQRKASESLYQGESKKWQKEQQKTDKKRQNEIKTKKRCSLCGCLPIRVSKDGVCLCHKGHTWKRIGR